MKGEKSQTKNEERPMSARKILKAFRLIRGVVEDTGAWDEDRDLRFMGSQILTD